MSTASTTTCNASAPPATSFFAPFCDSCGDRLPQLPPRAIACPSCGCDLVPLSVAERRKATPRQGRSEAKTAAFLSLLVPGSGQVFNGQFLKGFLIFATCWLVVPWVFGVIDAYRTAKRAERAHGAPQIL